MSGGNQSALLAALKWFELIDDVGAHGERLEDFVKAPEPGAVLRKMLPQAYKFMSDGSIQIDRATGSQVEEKFRDYGLTGSTIVKAMAFFISACKEAGTPLSAHIKLPKVVRTQGGSKPRKGRGQAAADGAEGEAEEGAEKPPQARTPAAALMDKFPTFDPSWTEKIQEQWFAAFGKMQDILKDK